MTAGRPDNRDDRYWVVSAEVTDAVAVAHRVAVLAETDPGAPLIVATRAALEVVDARRTARRDRRAAGLEVRGGDGAWWARWAGQWMLYAELATLRATPAPTTSPQGPELDVEDGDDGAGALVTPSRWSATLRRALRG